MTVKSYNHLYEKFLSEENYYVALKNATRHKNGKKRKHKLARYYKAHAEELKDQIMACAVDFKSEQHRPILIYDGIHRKQRKIIVPTMKEQIVHHMMVNVLKDIFMKGMYEHSYGSIPDRGVHLGKKRIQKWIRNNPKCIRYCLKMDIRKYYDSIPRKILKDKFAKLIHDEQFLKVLYATIDVDDEERGIPIGFYTSQWFANWYLTELDRYIKDELHAKFYARYVDDMVIFGSNKRKLHLMRMDIENYLETWLGLELKSNWQVFRFEYTDREGRQRGRCLDFMGYQFYRDRTILRRSIYIKMCRKARRISKKEKTTIYDCRQMLSYLGYIKDSDTYNAYKRHIKPFVCFQYLKRRMSSHQLKINKKEELHHVVSCMQRGQQQTDCT